MAKILALDASGQPDRWLSRNDAIVYHAKNLVAWQLGEGQGDVLYRGGMNRLSGSQSQIVTAPIISVKNESGKFKHTRKAPSLNNRELFRRDRFMCAYCGRLFSEERLTRDHIIPRSRKGLDVWTNVVTACDNCNHAKDDMLLEECGMQLLYIPYAPTRAEGLILENRNILQCQMDYLLGFVPEHSRVWQEVRAA
jgi:HNH endonuclease